MQVAQLCNTPFSIVHMIAFLTFNIHESKSSSSSHNLSRIITTIKINCNYNGSQYIHIAKREWENEWNSQWAIYTNRYTLCQMHWPGGWKCSEIIHKWIERTTTRGYNNEASSDDRARITTIITGYEPFRVCWMLKLQLWMLHVYKSRECAFARFHAHARERE